MHEQSGRSLIEIVGVLAIGVIMISAAYGMYRSIDQRQKRTIAYETVKDVAAKTKTLMEYTGYNGVSFANLQTAGAIDSVKTPIGSGWTIESVNSNTEFKITLNGLTYDECKYFILKKTDWATVASTPAKCTKGDNVTTFSVSFTAG